MLLKLEAIGQISAGLYTAHLQQAQRTAAAKPESDRSALQRLYGLQYKPASLLIVFGENGLPCCPNRFEVDSGANWVALKRPR